jgi:hypothetical protein
MGDAEKDSQLCAQNHSKMWGVCLLKLFCVNKMVYTMKRANYSHDICLDILSSSAKKNIQSGLL